MLNMGMWNKEGEVKGVSISIFTRDVSLGVEG